MQFSWAFRGGLLAAFMLMLGACGGLSDVGERDSVGPKAVATVFAHPYTAGSDGSATATVRSGTEIFLTGKDSEEGSSPIMNFEFAQSDSNAQIPVVIRTRNTVTLQAPSVGQNTTYKFKLTVTDANSNKSSTDITLNVTPVIDQNRFLTYFNARSTYRIVAVPVTSVAADPNAAETDQLGAFRISIRRLLTYRDRAGTVHTDVPIDRAPNALSLAANPNPPPLQIDGAWLTKRGATASCSPDSAPENPSFELPIPALDADDINLITQTGDRAEQLELGDIDEAELKVEVSIASTSGSVSPQVCVLQPGSSTDTIAPPAATVAASTRALQGDGTNALDTYASAVAYYKAIGEENTKTTLFAWLDANGFNHSAVNYGADAHAVYTNNFDLGFGRDMYAKVSCPPNAVSPGACDVAAVVINYVSLENAAKKTGPINAVAMEYSHTPTISDRRIVKFYAFAPNPRSTTGDFNRVHSVNLDGRGEKSVPASCTVCHGGLPGGVNPDGSYKNGGDLDSTFLPWDLDALLYSDTDQSFSRAKEDETLRSALTRPAQEAQLRALNASAYLTYADAQRHKLALELVGGWYTVGALPVQNLSQVLSGEHFGAFVPTGWDTNGADGVPGTGDDNPPDARKIYHDVFAPHCRACHVMQVPPAGGVPPDQCDNDPGNNSASLSGQVPIACYRQFVEHAKLATRMSAGEMPFARLTMDRLWTPATAGGTSAGAELIDHLSKLAVPVVVTTPGEPVIDFETPDSATLDIGSIVNLSPTLDATRFVSSVHWSVSHCPEGSPCSPVAVVNGDEPNASFVMDGVGDYTLTVQATSPTGKSAAPVTKTVTVAARSPNIPDLLPNQLTLGRELTLDPQVELGNGPKARHLFWVSDLGKLKFAPGTPACSSLQTACVLGTVLTLEADTGVVTPSTPNDFATYGQYTVNVIDADGSPASPRLQFVELTSGLSASQATVEVNANGSTSINFAEGVQLTSGDTVELQILSGPSAVGPIDSARLTGTGTSRTYSPPARYATHAKGSSPTVQAGKTQESIHFRLLRKDSGGTVVEQKDFTRNINIRATTTFSADVVTNVLRRQSGFPTNQQPCTNCHTPGYSGNPPVFDSNISLPDLYTELTGLFDLTDPNSDPGVSSTLVCWPSQDCTTVHTGGDRSTPGADDVATIRAWLRDGANNF